eukprot:14111884-Alexandrium_andersonii.AAC.1
MCPCAHALAQRVGRLDSRGSRESIRALSTRVLAPARRSVGARTCATIRRGARACATICRGGPP